MACRDLSSPSGTALGPPALKVWHPNHWSARESPQSPFTTCHSWLCQAESNPPYPTNWKWRQLRPKLSLYLKPVLEHRLLRGKTVGARTLSSGSTPLTPERSGPGATSSPGSQQETYREGGALRSQDRAGGRGWGSPGQGAGLNTPVNDPRSPDRGLR